MEVRKGRSENLIGYYNLVLNPSLFSEEERQLETFTL
jgi:hypothetical protein